MTKLIPGIRRSLLAAATLSALCAATALPLAQAQAPFPAREVTMVVPFGTGGSNDIFARALGQDLSRLWNRPVLIENRAGSGGSVGAAHVARAAADGHVLLFTSSAFVINAVLQKNLPFDPIAGFSPIALVGSGPMMLVARPNLGVKTAAELIALARSRPEGISFASVGVGSATHMALELFSSMAQAKFVHVPYKGGAQAITDLIAGHVDLYAGSVPQVLGHVRSGRALPIGIGGPAPRRDAQGLRRRHLVGRVRSWRHACVAHRLDQPRHPAGARHTTPAGVPRQGGGHPGKRPTTTIGRSRRPGHRPLEGRFGALGDPGSVTAAGLGGEATP
jgi:tripartite-type tricarboxylate transporter receptor subunit TctC